MYTRRATQTPWRITLDKPTAQRIVDRTMAVIGYSVNVINPEGIIIASGDPARVNESHQGAQRVAEYNEPLLVYEESTGDLPGVKPGVNLPILLDGQLVAIVGISGPPAQVARFADLVRITAELIVEQTAVLEISERRRRQIEETVLGWVGNQAVPEAWLEQLQIDPNQPRVAVVIEPGQSSPAPDPLMQVVRRFEQNDKDSLIAQVGPERLLILKLVSAHAKPSHSDAERWVLQSVMRHLTDLPLPDIKVAVGQFLDGNLKASYDSALSTLAIGKQKAPQQTSYLYSQWALPVLFHSLSPGWQLAELQRPLTMLSRDDRQNLHYRTLAAFIQHNGDTQACAASLHVHRNTVRYRLKSIEKITGLSPFRLADLCHLQLALTMDSKPDASIVRMHKIPDPD